MSLDYVILVFSRHEGKWTCIERVVRGKLVSLVVRGKREVGQ
jgi:hypothetical protein